MRKNYQVLYTLSSDTRRAALHISNRKEYLKLIRNRGYFDIRVERIVRAQREIAQQPKHKHKTK